MAAPTLERALTLAFGHEGGFQNDRRDKGNWTGGAVGKGTLKGTKYGISAATYPLLDIKNLTLAKAAEIYLRDDLGRIRGDDLPAVVTMPSSTSPSTPGPPKQRWSYSFASAWLTTGKWGRSLSRPSGGQIRRCS